MPIDGRSPRLAVLIDADNTSADYARPIFDEIAKLGDANVRRIYGDFFGERLKGWREVIQPLAIVPQQQFNNTKRKNAADIALVIDAMDLMHRGGLDGFCLVSSDSDFTRLARRLREDGAEVFGFGARRTPESFRDACSRFIYIEKLPKAAVEKGKTAAPPPTAAKKEPPTKAVLLIREAMKQAGDDEKGVNLSVIGKNLKQLVSGFEPKSYGCSSLVDLVEKTGKFDIDRPKQGGVRIKRR